MKTNGGNGINEAKTEELEVRQSVEQSILDRIIEEAGKQQSTLIPNKNEWSVYEAMAAMSAGTPFYSKLGGKAGIMAIMLYAREINMPPMTALNGGIDFVMGRLSITARTANERIRQAGHLVKIISIDQNGCSIYGKRKDTDEEHTSTFTIEDARRAQLIKKDSNWEKYPGDMCFARAITRLTRRLFPDVIGGASIEGEANETEEIQPEQISAPQDPKPSTIAGMAHEAKDPINPQKSKRKSSQSIDIPSDIHSASQQATVGESAQERVELPKQAATEQSSTPTKEQQAVESGAKLISETVIKFYEGDEILADDFLSTIFKDGDIHPSLDNLTGFTADQLRGIYSKVATEIKK